MIKKTVILLMLILYAACDFPSQPQSEQGAAINNIIFEYDQDQNGLFIQVELDISPSASMPDSVTAELFTLPDMVSAAEFKLRDDGQNGDILPENQVYSLVENPNEPLAFGIYQLRIHVHLPSGIISQNQSLVIEEEFSPAIIAMEVPGIYSIHPTEWTELHLSVTIDDPNGRDDIKYVRYQVNTDFLTVDCDGNYDPDGDMENYQSDPTWQMEYSQTTTDGYLVYDTNIPMRPVDDGEGGCGKTGIVFFRFLVKDMSNIQDVVSDVEIELVACGDGICQDEAENTNTCPEDCE